METKKNNLGYMFMLAVISIATTMFLSVSHLTKTILPFSFDTTWLALTDLSLSSYNNTWAKFIVFNFGTAIFTLILAIFLFVLFIKESKYFPKAIVLYLMIKILLIAVTFYLQTIIKGPPTPTAIEIVNTIIRSLAIVIIWIPFILLSSKAEETFIK